MRSKRIGLLLGIMLIGWVFVAGKADAALLNFDIFLPDILSDSVGVYNYDAGTDLFTSTAIPLTITFTGLPGSLIPITGTYPSTLSYSVGFHVDALGNFSGGITGDDLVIKGAFTYDSILYSGTLLSGEVTNFGWLDTGSGALFDYTFDFTGGALSSFYAGYGNRGGDKMYAEIAPTFTGVFTADHSGTKVKHDTAPVPEPSSLLLLGGGLLSAALLRVRRKK